ncbi:MAG: small subunit ribosomal protein [Patescibacteria group bacterium]|nr:small subunit ribosomal protein [Patescibacteria group bacterium]
MRIAGITLPENKRMDIALTAVYGIGRPAAKRILEVAGVDAALRTPDLTPEMEAKIKTEIDKIKIEGDLSREIDQNIKRLKDIKSYRGVRHIRHLPTRGQRTKTNSRTIRGNVRRTMGSGRRKAEKT